MTTAAERNRPPFKVRGTATIKHLNVRKDGLARRLRKAA